MKKITQILIFTMIALGATAFIAYKSTSKTPTQSAPVNVVWFNTIEIAEGITVEFEYGTRLQVFVEGDQELIKQMAVVLENHVLKATGKNSQVPVEGIRIKVVTPVLINLAQENNRKNEAAEQASTQVHVQPVLMQPKLFQVYVNA